MGSGRDPCGAFSCIGNVLVLKLDGSFFFAEPYAFCMSELFCPISEKAWALEAGTLGQRARTGLCGCETSVFSSRKWDRETLC